MKLFLGLLFLVSSSFTYADANAEPCEVVAHWGAIITVACPGTVDNSAIANAAYQIQRRYSAGEMRKILFFSEKRLTPRNERQIGKMNEQTFSRVFLGAVTYNGLNGLNEFRCRTSGEKMGNCTAYLK